MKRFMSLIFAGSLALGSVAVLGVSSASAATTATTITLTNPNAILNDGAFTITATTSVAGTVDFTAATVSIAGCAAVATGTTTPFLATCSWTPAAAGAISLGATFTPTDATDYAGSTATPIAEIVATPVQGTPSAPISIYVDTILAAGSTGVLAPEFGAGCEITNEFIVGQTIVFRAYGNDWSLNGAALTSLNVSSATVTVTGVATPLKMAYGNHGGVAFWTAALKTGTAAGDYNTLGLIGYTVTFNTIAVPAVTKKVKETKLVPTIKNGKKVIRHGKVVTHRVTYLKTVVVTPAVAGASATFQSAFNPASVATLNAVPAT
ncbi:MAG: hypothetical protein ACLPKZ_01590 [Acidimicrobiales bacterium]